MQEMIVHLQTLSLIVFQYTSMFRNITHGIWYYTNDFCKKHVFGDVTAMRFLAAPLAMPFFSHLRCCGCCVKVYSTMKKGIATVKIAQS